MLNRRRSGESVQRADRELLMSEIGAEQEIDRLVSEIGEVIRTAEAARRADLQDYAATLLNQQINVAELQEPIAQPADYVQRRQNPLAAGLLLILAGTALGLLTLAVGATLAIIGLALVIWGGVMSWRRREKHV